MMAGEQKLWNDLSLNRKMMSLTGLSWSPVAFESSKT